MFFPDCILFLISPCVSFLEIIYRLPSVYNIDQTIGIFRDPMCRFLVSADRSNWVDNILVTGAHLQPGL